MNSLRLCLEILRFWRRIGWPYIFGCLCLAYGLALASPKSSRRPGCILYWQRFSRVRNTSSYFDSTSWLHFPWDRCFTAGELRYRSLIPKLHRVPSNLSCLFGGELHVQAVQRPILGDGIGCKVSRYLLVGTVDRLWSHYAWQWVFRIRKRPRLNRKYFNRAMIPSEPCYNGTIYVQQKFREWQNFVDNLSRFHPNCEKHES